MLKRLMSKMNHAQKGITGLETAIILIAFVVVAAVFAYTVLSAGLFSTQKSSEAVYTGLEETQSTVELRGGVTAYSTSGTGTGADTIDRSDGTSDLSTYNSSTNDKVVTRVQFVMANVLGGEPIDLSAPWTVASTVDPPSDLTAATNDTHTLVIAYDDKYTHIPDCAWTVAWIGDNDGDHLLEANEKAQITVWLVEHNGTDFNLAAAGSSSWMSNTQDATGENNEVSKLINRNHEFRLQLKTAEGAVMFIERTTPANLDNVMNLN